MPTVIAEVEKSVDLDQEWCRSRPDVVVFRPRGEAFCDTDNEHFLVFPSIRGHLLAVWTQSSVEGFGNNHIVQARSDDGIHWDRPRIIAGSTANRRGEDQASWAFPVVSRQGRIYVFFTKGTKKVDVHSQCCGLMGCVYSDDDGHSWLDGGVVEMARNRFDHPDPSMPRNWIVWQKPIRDSRGRWLAGFTQHTSRAVCPPAPAGWWSHDSRCQFMRFDNVDEAPPPSELKITWLPEDPTGLAVAYPGHSEISVCQEPSLVLLPDGRLMCITRTFTGYIWYSISADDGRSWRPMERLCHRDGGRPVAQPLAPCPIYPLDAGRFLLLFHNNTGHLGHFTPEDFCHNRNPAYIAVGEFRPGAHQPVWFSAPKAFLDTNGVAIGPKGTSEIATYTSMTHVAGRHMLWYPDRKYYLLGRQIRAADLAGMVVEEAG